MLDFAHGWLRGMAERGRERGIVTNDSDSAEKETDFWTCPQDASSVATMLTTTEAQILKRTLYNEFLLH